MINFIFNEKEKSRLIKIKHKIVNTHAKCKGIGYIPDGEGRVKYCSCMKVLNYISNLVYSNIPIDYWKLDFSELSVSSSLKDDLSKYITNIDNVIDNGVGLLLTSEKRGVGKTSIACEIAKKAIIKRYDVYYNLLGTVIDNFFSDEKEIINKIKEADLVVIDELDRVMMKENSPLIKKIENFLRDLLPNGKSVILCSNSLAVDIKNRLGIDSLIDRYMKTVEFVGDDFSKEKNKQLDTLIDGNFNYMHKNIVKAAQEYFENEYIATEREYNQYFI